MPIQIAIAESNDLVRLGLKTLIAEQSAFLMQFETESFDQLLKALNKHTPDVILVDAELKDGNCIDYLPQILSKCPACKVLVFSDAPNVQLQLDAFLYGAAGALVKAHHGDLLLKAIERVHAGEVWFDRQLMAELWKVHHQSPTIEPFGTSIPADDPYNLTFRECSVANLASKGQPIKYIAATLNISEKTVRNQLSIIYEKLAIASQVELCVMQSQLTFCQCHKSDNGWDNCPKRSQK